jgi:hypothetical protein
MSVAKHLMAGRILEEGLFPYPSLRDKDRDAEQPEQFIQGLRDPGLFGLIIPEELRGVGLSNAGYARVLSQSSSHDSSVSLTIGAHSSIGMKGILLFGTAEQKACYLPRLASGEMIAAFCLTESGAGSDAASIRTQAVKNADGSWVLNGEKIWITNGGIADLYTVFARTSTTTVNFADVRVPAANVLDAEGKGFKVAMAVLNNGRTGLGGGAVGGMKTLIAHAVQQADDIFNNFIKGFGVLTDYAEKRLTQATGVGRDKILTPLPQPLREAAEIYERYTVELAKASDHLLRKHGKAIADRQHDLKRIADIGIDLFVGLCVLSRAAALSKAPGERGLQAMGTARVFAQQAKRRMANTVRRITRNEDEEMDRLAGFILDNGSYSWDVMS